MEFSAIKKKGEKPSAASPATVVSDTTDITTYLGILLLFYTNTLYATFQRMLSINLLPLAHSWGYEDNPSHLMDSWLTHYKPLPLFKDSKQKPPFHKNIVVFMRETNSS